MSRIKIILKSDLCAASGDGFSSVIDTDVSYDKYGFPVIGARRLKGCLRDAAELIGADNINEIFGTSGSEKSGSLKISDAHIKGYEELKQEAVSSGLNAEEVISLFTYTRASTAIENDTAKDNSLRFTRVVKHFSPLTDTDNMTETEFEAEADIDEQYAAEFSDICKALRNIGYKRNRGYGAVKCSFESEKKKSLPSDVKNIKGDTASITYLIRLKDNVMLPSSASDETADYISGTSVMGFFANEYLRSNSADENFENIFLKNNVAFSNLYISDEKMTEYFPAPVILGKIKGEDGAFNIVTYKKDESTIIKPVKSGYSCFDSVIKKPLTETVYHHTRGSEANLYTQTSLCSGQYFRGTITGKSEYVKIIYDILTHSTLRFGRSKTAQYSACELVKADISPVSDSVKTIRSGEQFIVLLLSDVLIPDEAGGYDISVQGLQKAVGHGIEKLECDKGETVKRSALRYRIIAGYNSKWNIQKPQIRTIAAGSTLVFRAESDMKFPSIFTAGAKINEGFGKVMICRPEDFAERSVKTEKDVKTADKNGALCKLIAKNQTIEEMRSKAISFAASFGRKMNSSQIGRYTMMVKQANDLGELRHSMIENIKSKSSHDYIDNIIKKSEAEHYRDNWRDYLLLILTLIKYQNRGEKNNDQN